jgi:aspartyl-tRNA(Asn)/glutamyl-tRNA(Gln) amidotransferase subunit A
MKIDLKNMTIEKAHKSLMKGDFTAVELTKAYLEEIKKKDKDIHAYLEVFEDAVDSASSADQMIKSGKATMMTGIPIAIKDNILNKGKIASSASKMLEKYHSTYDATALAKLKEQGVVILGRTNMDEFAMGGSTEKSAYGTTHNPHDLERVPGGTSGGSAAAVASDMALAALGSDTGGSIRQPSSFCGVVGLKPTYGRVSRYGLMSAVSSFDQIGPITRTVSDNEILFDAIRGLDPHDGTTISEKTYSPERIGAKKPVMGIPRSFLKMGGINDDVKKAFDSAEKRFKDLNYKVVDIELPNNEYALPVYYILNFAEISANMARFDGVRYGLHVSGKDGIDDYFESRRAGLGKEVIRRILLGTYVLSSGYYDAYYNRANAVRRMITDDFSQAFRSVDVIITPTAPSPAYKIGEKNDDPIAMYLEDIFTVTANLTGLPAISIPCGVSKKLSPVTTATKQKNSEIEGGLPIGLLMTARHGDEKTLFETGREFLQE